MASTTGYPSLHQIPGALITFKLFPRPDLRQVCHLFPETVFAGENDIVPGLDLKDLKNIYATPTITATISKISLSMYPTIRQLEDPMLTRVSRLYYEAHPESLVNLVGDYPKADIIERRIHVGAHNGLHFLGTPFTTTLEPTFDDEIGDGFDLSFNGHLEIAKVSLDVGVALVFVVEYKVRVLTSEQSSPKKSGISALIEKIGGAAPVETVSAGVDRDVCLGWGFWSPANGYGLLF